MKLLVFILVCIISLSGCKDNNEGCQPDYSRCPPAPLAEPEIHFKFINQDSIDLYFDTICFDFNELEITNTINTAYDEMTETIAIIPQFFPHSNSGLFILNINHNDSISYDIVLAYTQYQYPELGISCTTCPELYLYRVSYGKDLQHLRIACEKCYEQNLVYIIIENEKAFPAGGED